MTNSWFSLCHAMNTTLFPNKNSQIYRDKICKFKSELQTQSYIYRLESVRTTLSAWIDGLEFSDPGTCCMNSSKAKRNEGNALYRKDKQAHAWEIYELYTSAVLSAPSVSEEVALAHANRAASLMTLKLYREAYDDCECALLYGYEEKSVPKLLIRQMHCASDLKDKKLMAEAIAKMRKYESGLNKDFQTQFLGFVEEFESLGEMKPKAGVEEFKEKAQKVCSSAAKGRYVLANEDISAHEPFISEKAFAFAPILPVDEDKIHLQCANCALELIVSFPCHNCKQMSFCSLQCKLDHEKFHKFECMGLRNGLLEKMSSAYVALRTFLTGFEELQIALGDKKFTSPEAIWKGIFEAAKVRNLRYHAVLQMVTHLDKTSPDKTVICALTASALVCYLKKNQFFASISNSFDWEIVCASLLMRHISQMMYNSCPLKTIAPTYPQSSWMSNEHRVRPGKLHVLSVVQGNFAAIYPRMSLYNHSCVPSYSCKFDKTTYTAVANNRILKGQEIFNSYGITAKSNSKFKRMMDLKTQYCFTCDCTECSSEDVAVWRQFRQSKCRNCENVFVANLKPLDITNIAKGMQYECPVCKAKYKNEWFSDLQDIVTQKNVLDCLPELIDILESARLITSGPHAARIEANSFFIKIFVYTLDRNPSAKLAPSMWASIIRVADDLIESGERFFGDHSLEFVSIAAFYLDLMVISGRKVKRIKTIRTAMQILPDRIRELYEGYIDEYAKP